MTAPIWRTLLRVVINPFAVIGHTRQTRQARRLRHDD
jgi:hypothetical protein